MQLVVMIPCLNEEKTIAQVIKEIPKNIPGIKSVKILVIDDGSTDSSVKIAKQAGANRIISHKQNLGLGVSFRNGLDEALKKCGQIKSHASRQKMGQSISFLGDQASFRICCQGRAIRFQGFFQGNGFTLEHFERFHLCSGNHYSGRQKKI
jgi:hypothetical protein